MYSGKGKKDEEDGLGGGGNPFAGIQKVRSKKEMTETLLHDFDYIELPDCHLKLTFRPLSTCLDSCHVYG